MIDGMYYWTMPLKHELYVLHTWNMSARRTLKHELYVLHT
jgi:hypothetical protein